MSKKKSKVQVNKGYLAILGLAVVLLGYMWRGELKTTFRKWLGMGTDDLGINLAQVGEEYAKWMQQLETEAGIYRDGLWRKIPDPDADDAAWTPPSTEEITDNESPVVQETASLNNEKPFMPPPFHGISRVDGGEWRASFDGLTAKQGDVVEGPQNRRFLIVAMDEYVTWLLLLEDGEQHAANPLDDGGQVYVLNGSKRDMRISSHDFPSWLKIREYPGRAVEAPGGQLLTEKSKFSFAERAYEIELISKHWFLCRHVDADGNTLAQFVCYAY